VNESESASVFLAAVLAQKSSAYWEIFDEDAKRDLIISGTEWAGAGAIDRLVLENTAITKSAPSISALAKETHLPAAVLEETIRKYNAFVAAGEDTELARFGAS